MSQTDQHELDSVYGCWLWTGSFSTTNGRPIIWNGRTPVNAYKVIYEQKRGAVAADLVLDHMCRRATSCVNPDHIEAVTKSENERRKTMRYRLQRKMCSRGHVLNETTRMLTPEGGVLCRACMVVGGGVDYPLPRGTHR